MLIFWSIIGAIVLLSLIFLCIDSIGAKSKFDIEQKFNNITSSIQNDKFFFSETKKKLVNFMNSNTTLEMTPILYKPSPPLNYIMLRPNANPIPLLHERIKICGSCSNYTFRLENYCVKCNSKRLSNVDTYAKKNSTLILLMHFFCILAIFVGGFYYMKSLTEIYLLVSITAGCLILLLLFAFLLRKKRKYNQISKLVNQQMITLGISLDFNHSIQLILDGVSHNRLKRNFLEEAYESSREISLLVDSNELKSAKLRMLSLANFTSSDYLEVDSMIVPSNNSVDNFYVDYLARIVQLKPHDLKPDLYEHFIKNIAEIQSKVKSNDQFISIFKELVKTNFYIYLKPLSDAKTIHSYLLQIFGMTKLEHANEICLYLTSAIHRKLESQKNYSSDEIALVYTINRWYTLNSTFIHENKKYKTLESIINQNSQSEIQIPKNQADETFFSLIEFVIEKPNSNLSVKQLNYLIENYKLYSDSMVNVTSRLIKIILHLTLQLLTSKTLFSEKPLNYVDFFINLLQSEKFYHFLDEHEMHLDLIQRFKAMLVKSPASNRKSSLLYECANIYVLRNNFDQLNEISSELVSLTDYKAPIRYKTFVSVINYLNQKRPDIISLKCFEYLLYYSLQNTIDTIKLNQIMSVSSTVLNNRETSLLDDELFFRFFDNCSKLFKSEVEKDKKISWTKEIADYFLVNSKVYIRQKQMYFVKFLIKLAQYLSQDERNIVYIASILKRLLAVKNENKWIWRKFVLELTKTNFNLIIEKLTDKIRTELLNECECSDFDAFYATIESNQYEIRVNFDR
jgi:hypothetical protein